MTINCGSPLTPDNVPRRIEALLNDDDDHLQKFLNIWGEPIGRKHS